MSRISGLACALALWALPPCHGQLPDVSDLPNLDGAPVPRKQNLERRTPSALVTVAPAIVHPGEGFSVSIKHFYARDLRCTLSFDVMAGAEPGGAQPELPAAEEFVCGPRDVSRKFPGFAAPGKVAVSVEVCGMPNADDPRKSDCGTTVEHLVVVGKLRRTESLSGSRATTTSRASGPILPPPSPPPPAAPDAGPGRETDPELMKTLQGRDHRLVRSHEGRVRREYRGPDEEDQARKRKQFQLALLKDDQVRQAYDDWAALEDAQRKAAISRVALLHSKAYGLGTAPVDFGKAGDGTLDGIYRNPPGRITINDKMQRWNDPDYAFGIAAHEDAHHYQDVLIRRLESGQLKPGDENYDRAKKYKENRDSYCSTAGGVGRKCGYDEYRAQAMEQDANQEQESATRHLRSQASRNTFEDYQGGKGGRR